MSHEIRTPMNGILVLQNFARTTVNGKNNKNISKSLRKKTNKYYQ
jgi:signal transduction histidine kinase